MPLRRHPPRRDREARRDVTITVLTHHVALSIMQETSRPTSTLSSLSLPRGVGSGEGEGRAAQPRPLRHGHNGGKRCPGFNPGECQRVCSQEPQVGYFPVGRRRRRHEGNGRPLRNKQGVGAAGKARKRKSAMSFHGLHTAYHGAAGQSRPLRQRRVGPCKFYVSRVDVIADELVMAWGLTRPL